MFGVMNPTQASTERRVASRLLNIGLVVGVAVALVELTLAWVRRDAAACEAAGDVECGWGAFAAFFTMDR